MTVLKFAQDWIAGHTDHDRGASLVEYALLVVLIALVAIGAVTALGGGTSENFSEMTSLLG